MIFKDKLACARGGVDGEEIPLKSPTPGGKDPVVMSKKEKKRSRRRLTDKDMVLSPVPPGQRTKNPAGTLLQVPSDGEWSPGVKQWNTTPFVRLSTCSRICRAGKKYPLAKERLQILNVLEFYDS